MDETRIPDVFVCFVGNSTKSISKAKSITTTKFLLYICCINGITLHCNWEFHLALWPTIRLTWKQNFSYKLPCIVTRFILNLWSVYKETPWMKCSKNLFYPEIFNVYIEEEDTIV